MPNSEIEELNRIKDDLWRFLETYGEDGDISNELCDFHWNVSERTGYLRGNMYGLGYVAYQLLMTAASECESTHSHLDEYSGMEEGSDPIIISKQPNLDK